MANVYKTVRGKVIDIDKLKITNENTVAVGNMRVNARGDVLGAGNQVLAGRNEVMDQVYAIEEAPYSPNDPTSHMARQTLIEANAKKLSELADSLIVTTTEAPAETPVVSSTRGSLASAVAKTTTVTQEPLPKPIQQKKSNGPTRI